MNARRYADLFSETLKQEILVRSDELTEIRLRPNQRAELVTREESILAKEKVSPKEIQKIALKLMNHSYYACEKELAEGFFTLSDGARVGVCGTFSEIDGECRLQTIGSLCLRIPRAVPGCGEALAKAMTDGGLRSAVVVSRPGMGKTTVLRDTARLLSEKGYRVGIADERHEIAACCGGVPSLNVGSRTDVIDGGTKKKAIEKLLRAMSPQIIVADEIGNAGEADAVRESVCRGAALLTSVHAESFEALERGFLGELVREGAFPLAVLLDGRPGKIAQIKYYSGGER